MRRDSATSGVAQGLLVLSGMATAVVTLAYDVGRLAFASERDRRGTALVALRRGGFLTPARRGAVANALRQGVVLNPARRGTLKEILP